MQYLARFIEDGDGFIVTFPGVPEAMTHGATRAAARNNAAEALELALLGAYYARDLPLPAAGKRPQEGGSFEWIGVPPAAIAKMAFIDAFRAVGTTRVALAAKLGKSEGEVRRMLNPTYGSKINTLEAGLRALGRRLVVTVEAA
ncbi:MAG: type II toxin-antitoxin system HicB family antitoxin [Devosia nanyangense]|uniref:Type II toxin-antitoxin system HicB family antitoxin n=1 Tax=Devosia nanyangense TaxID=1228055 RepID=A0A933L1X6_9HYPH|nr:type II toxin-antitoxin system HicB family antitoxin [Devosia nanyangense]